VVGAKLSPVAFSIHPSSIPRRGREGLGRDTKQIRSSWSLIPQRGGPAFPICRRCGSLPEKKISARPIVFFWFRPGVRLPHQNREQLPAERRTCGGEDEPKDAHAELVSSGLGFKSVHQLMALLSGKRPPILESVRPALLHIFLL
jgi:hypothetical protein